MSIDRLHTEACANGAISYIDPTSGFRVFTAIALEQRQRCCGCGCRHCPYGHDEVDAAQRARLEQEPWLLGPPPAPACDLLFWSGGKDSYLALRAMQREDVRPVVLATTFDGRSELVAHQELQLSQIKEQARQLELPILLIPLYPGRDYVERVLLGLGLLRRRVAVKRLAFGDLHLDHVRSWREEALEEEVSTGRISLHFPLWKVPYSDLVTDLEDAPVTCRISAIADSACADILEVGDIFNRKLLERLPAEADAFGENGEFHTWVQFVDHHASPRASSLA